MIIDTNRLKKAYTKCIIDGGITLDSKAHIPDDLKYIVSYEGGLIYDLDDLDYDTFAKAWIVLGIKDNELFGVWISDGLVYFDKSVSIDNMIDAIELGLKNNQLAIYDNILHNTIRIRRQ